MMHEQLQLWLYDLGETEYSWLELPTRRFPYWVVSHVARGQVKAWQAGNERTVQGGEVMVHPPNQPFREQSGGAGVHQWMLLQLHTRDGSDLLRRHAVAPVVELENPALYSQQFRQLHALWSGPKHPLRDVQALGLVVSLLGQLLPLGGSSQPDRFAPVVARLQAHLAHPVRRRDLADLAQLHPSHLDRAFKAAHGVTPMQMLRGLRLERVRYLLEQTPDTLEAIAEACGFSSAAYLSRVFQVQYQQTPGEYRRRVKSANRGYLSVLTRDSP